MDTKKTPQCVLVTGCSGFIGGAFVRAFRAEFPTTKIVGIDDLSAGNRKSVGSGVVFSKGSIADEAFLEKIFKTHKPDYVFHFAAIPRIPRSWVEPTLTTSVNVVGTVALLKKAVDYHVRRFIFASSSSIYGGSPMHRGSGKLISLKEGASVSPRSPYALQKLVGEQFCKMYSDRFGIDTVCLRFFTVFGPGQRGNASYATIVSAWLESVYFPGKKEGFLEGDGTQSRDFTFIDDVIQAVMKAMRSPRKFRGEVFNVGSGNPVSVLTVKALIERYTRKKLKLRRLPSRPGDVKHTRADIGKAGTLLGYEPRWNFEKGLQKTVEWFEELGKRKN